MCGICGFIDHGARLEPEALEPIAGRMIDQLRHRGPDDRGTWLDRERGLALGHARLSILDLSPQGRQPMVSSCGRYVIVYNGEIYNFSALRTSLQEGGARFKGRSDTEILLEAIRSWGLVQATRRSVGMFAFALWDVQEAELHLVRDRLGKKPLYYGWSNQTFLFGSELKALKAHPHFQAEIDRNALSLYLRHSCIPSPYTVYQGFSKVPPATILTLSARGMSMKSYWSALEMALEGVLHGDLRSEEECLEELETLVEQAVRDRLVSDVPLGAFLSGGIDSSLVVAMMQSQSSRPVRTFTIGFPDKSHDEAEGARAVARHLGTDHFEHQVSWEEALGVVSSLPGIYDEPFSDSSQIPTYLVSQIARSKVTVCLTGDGGDEGFGGYNRHLWAAGIWRWLGPIPVKARKVLASVLTFFPPQLWNELDRYLAPLLPRRLRHRLPGDKLQKLAGVLAASGPRELYRGLVSHWLEPTLVLPGASEPASVLTPGPPLEIPDFRAWMMYMDTVTYLPDDILTKVDRATMATSLEARCPLLDHRLLEFAWRLPMSMKIRDGTGKWALRRLLSRHLPRELFERPKMGFQIPIAAWLRGPLREWASDLLSPSMLNRDGLLDPTPIVRRWQQHLSGRRNWHDSLWDVLMLCAWLGENRR